MATWSASGKGDPCLLLQSAFVSGMSIVSEMIFYSSLVLLSYLASILVKARDHKIERTLPVVTCQTLLRLPHNYVNAGASRLQLC
jgi:hypothetical protein